MRQTDVQGLYNTSCCKLWKNNDTILSVRQVFFRNEDKSRLCWVSTHLKALIWFVSATPHHTRYPNNCQKIAVFSTFFFFLVPFLTRCAVGVSFYKIFWRSIAVIRLRSASHLISEYIIIPSFYRPQIARHDYVVSLQTMNFFCHRTLLAHAT
jgi:hypothetical protein